MSLQIQSTLASRSGTKMSSERSGRSTLITFFSSMATLIPWTSPNLRKCCPIAYTLYMITRIWVSLLASRTKVRTSKSISSSGSTSVRWRSCESGESLYVSILVSLIKKSLAECRKIWNGEFGPVYASPNEENHDRINEQRYQLLGKQLSIYKEDQIHWSIWLYKDIGFQGMVYTKPDSAYIRLLKPFLDKKKRLGLDAWGRDDTHVKHIWEPVIHHLKEEIPEQFQGKRYPFHWGLEKQISRVVRDMVMSELLTYEFASYFENKTLDELDELAASFKLENCLKRDGLNKILQEDAEK
jgi:hypothetical protein